MLRPLKTEYFLVIGLVAIMPLICKFQPTVSFASPAFGHQEIQDKSFDWINMTNRTPAFGLASTDIWYVDYFSDGKILNATLWFTNFTNTIPGFSGKRNYGMFIDADVNNHTGLGGIDYQIEISGQNGSWTRDFLQWSTTAATNRTLENTGNYTGFFEKNHGYVLLSANLSYMGSPDKYKVVFYAEQKNDSMWIGDFSDWVSIPPPEYDITPVPNSKDLRQGDEEKVHVQVKSTSGSEPNIHLFVKEKPSQIGYNFGRNDFTVPSYGVIAVPLIINASKDALVSPYTLTILGKGSFPSQELLFGNFSLSLPSQGITKTSTLTINVLKMLPWYQPFINFWNELGSPITFFYGVILGLIPWILNYVRKKLKMSGQRRLDDLPK